MRVLCVCASSVGDMSAARVSSSAYSNYLIALNITQWSGVQGHRDTGTLKKASLTSGPACTHINQQHRRRQAIAVGVGGVRAKGRKVARWGAGATGGDNTNQSADQS